MCSYHRFVPLNKISSRIFSTARSSLSAPTAVRTIRTVRLNSLADIVSSFPCLRVLERSPHAHLQRTCCRSQARTTLATGATSRSPAHVKSPFKHKTREGGPKIHGNLKKIAIDMIGYDLNTPFLGRANES